MYAAAALLLLAVILLAVGVSVSKSRRRERESQEAAELLRKFKNTIQFGSIDDVRSAYTDEVGQAIDPLDCTSMLLAVNRREADIVRQLLVWGFHEGYAGCQAVRTRDMEIFKEIMAACPSCLKTTDRTGNLPLHHAARKGYAEFVDDILVFEPPVSLPGGDRWKEKLVAWVKPNFVG